MSRSMTTEAATIAVNALAMLPFFPSSNENGMMALADEIYRMCPTVESCETMIEVVFARWPRWLGPLELRIVLCGIAKPKDGKDTTSESKLFPEEGYPSTHPQALQIAPPERKRLEPGEPVSEDPELEAILRRAIEKQRARQRATLTKPATPDEIAELKRIQRERAQNDTTREILAKLEMGETP